MGHNLGTISGSYAKTTRLEAGRHDDSVGGLVGYNEGGTIKHSYATGKAEGADGGDHVGGLVGLNNNGTIENNYATGEASGGGSSDATGGLIGAYTQLGRVAYNYVTGKVESNSGTKDSAGGIVGRLESSFTDPNISTNYHNSDASVDDKKDGYNNGRPLTILRIATPSSIIPLLVYTGWSTTHWDFGDVDALPKVRFNGSLVLGQ